MEKGVERNVNIGKLPPLLTPFIDTGFPSAHNCEPANPSARKAATMSLGKDDDPRWRGKSPPADPPIHHMIKALCCFRWVSMFR